MQIAAASAWLLSARGDAPAALEQMRKAAQLEDRLGKHPVTPGAVIPARELLGELLLEQHRRPKRGSSSGPRCGARKHFTALVAMGARGDGVRPELAEARRFVESAAGR